nr:uncharacterized protein LOC113822142 [Penaeus vannamei]
MSVCEENINAVRYLIEKDMRITTESVADTLNISVDSAHTGLVESLGLSKLSARWVPRLLRPDQQQTRNDPEDEIQSKQWLPRGRRGPVKAKSERSRGKVMATVFWDAERILLVDFLQNTMAITSAYY